MLYVHAWSVIDYFWGQISNSGPVHWEQLIQMGTKALSPIWKKLICVSVVAVRMNLQEMYACLSNVPKSNHDLMCVCTCESHMLSGLYPGASRGGSWIHALLGIFDLPTRLRGTALSGITLSRRVDTNYKRQHITKTLTGI